MTSPTPNQQAALAAAEPMYLVMAGGDGFTSSIVPASKLDDAYLRTQWWTIDPSDSEQHADALAHFHDDGEWTHTDVTGGGDRLEFSLSLEDGWVKVIRLFEVGALAAAAPVAEMQPVASPCPMSGEAAIGFSPMWLAPIDGTPVLLYMPTAGDKFAVGQFHGDGLDTVRGNWGDDEGNFYVHDAVGWMGLHVLERLAAPQPLATARTLPHPAQALPEVVAWQAVKRPCIEWTDDKEAAEEWGRNGWRITPLYASPPMPQEAPLVEAREGKS